MVMRTNYYYSIIRMIINLFFWAALLTQLEKYTKLVCTLEPLWKLMRSREYSKEKCEITMAANCVYLGTRFRAKKNKTRISKRRRKRGGENNNFKPPKIYIFFFDSQSAQIRNQGKGSGGVSSITPHVGGRPPKPVEKDWRWTQGPGWWMNSPTNSEKKMGGVKKNCPSL